MAVDILVPFYFPMVFGHLLRTQDILSPALSPAALFSLLPDPALAPNQTAILGNGNLAKALSTMDFHRSMMNEYLCHNYLVGEILSDLNSIESRTGKPATSSKRSEGAKDHLLVDLGSAGYKEWLDKSAQLEDMYTKVGKKVMEEQQVYETGDVTGYATIPGSTDSSYNSYLQPAEFAHPAGGVSFGASGVGVNGWSDEGGGLGWQDNGGYDVSAWGEHDTGKGLALKDLFDLGLTALAFLTFGIFVLNLVMTCFSKTPNINLMTTNSTIPPTASGRTSRGMRGDYNQLNELAYRVLSTVDNFIESGDRPARKHCLEFILCDNNKSSRALYDNNKLWLPVWSLGISWVSSSRLESLRASVLGLGDADCAVLYPQCASTVQRKST